jgi:hypothetical protein
MCCFYICRSRQQCGVPTLCVRVIHRHRYWHHRHHVQYLCYEWQRCQRGHDHVYFGHRSSCNHLQCRLWFCRGSLHRVRCSEIVWIELSEMFDKMIFSVFHPSFILCCAFDRFPRPLTLFILFRPFSNPFPTLSACNDMLQVFIGRIRTSGQHCRLHHLPGRPRNGHGQQRRRDRVRTLCCWTHVRGRGLP